MEEISWCLDERLMVSYQWRFAYLFSALFYWCLCIPLLFVALMTEFWCDHGVASLSSAFRFRFACVFSSTATLSSLPNGLFSLRCWFNWLLHVSGIWYGSANFKEAIFIFQIIEGMAGEEVLDVRRLSLFMTGLVCGL